MGSVVAPSVPKVDELESRRLELGMSRAALARRAGVSLPTVDRILTGGETAPRLGNVQAIAQALGIEVRLVPVADSEELCRRQAEHKAREIARLVQGTMGLEAQGVSAENLEALVKRTMIRLLAGSRRKLWE